MKKGFQDYVRDYYNYGLCQSGINLVEKYYAGKLPLMGINTVGD